MKAQNQWSLTPLIALHLAVAQQHGYDEFWTNDDRLNTVAEKMAVNVLSRAAP